MSPAHALFLLVVLASALPCAALLAGPEEKALLATMQPAQLETPERRARFARVLRLVLKQSGGAPLPDSTMAHLDRVFAGNLPVPNAVYPELAELRPYLVRAAQREPDPRRWGILMAVLQNTDTGASEPVQELLAQALVSRTPELRAAAAYHAGRFGYLSPEVLRLLGAAARSTRPEHRQAAEAARQTFLSRHVYDLVSSFANAEWQMRNTFFFAFAVPPLAPLAPFYDPPVALGSRERRLELMRRRIHSDEPERWNRGLVWLMEDILVPPQRAPVHNEVLEWGPPNPYAFFESYPLFRELSPADRNWLIAELRAVLAARGITAERLRDIRASPTPDEELSALLRFCLAGHSPIERAANWRLWD